MNMLLQVSSGSYKTYFSLAKEINILYPKVKFGFVSKDKIAVDFIKKQHILKYEIFHEEASDKVDLSKPINFNIIKNFEERSNCFIWKIVSSDRQIGGAFLHNSLGYGSKYQNNKEYILKRVEQRIIAIDDIFKKFKPDIFIPAMAMGNIDVGIYEGMCKIHNAQYAVVTVSRVKNYCAFSGNAMLNFDKIDSDTRRMIDGNEEPSKDAVNLYNDLIEEIEDPDYFDLDIEKVENKNILEKLNIFSKYIVIKPTIMYIKSLLQCVKSLLARRLDKCHCLSGNFTKWFIQGMQLLMVSDSRFGKKLKKNQKYLYYPLHLTPEYSTLVQGGMVQDQLAIIEFLAKSVPADWIVYVKEHPATLKNRIRPLHFYSKINSIPNVEMAPTYLSMHGLISRAEMVATITGTSGWEAVLRNTPVIGFSDYIDVYDPLGFSSKCGDLNNLSSTMHSLILKLSDVSHEERACRIKLLLTSILNNSFWVTFPKQLFYDEIGTDYEYSVCGKELADGLIRHLSDQFK